MNILVTGAAGFIGFHLSKTLLAQGHDVMGLDNLNDYYDPKLKLARLAELQTHPSFSFHKLDLIDAEALQALFANHSFDCVVNLAAQAGVRYSLTNPQAYIDANLTGFLNILENCRHHQIKHLVFASSSSVYGSHTHYPFTESEPVDHPVSLYAASKKANELMAHTYAHLFNLPCTGLRFFTVYGPWGRPDMALFKFTEALLKGEPIDVYNYGEMERDFTYVDDIISGLVCVIEKPATSDSNWKSEHPNPATSHAPYRIYNIGRGNPVKLLDFITALEAVTGKKASLNLLPMQPGDVAKTYADTSQLVKDFGFKPNTSIETGIAQFVDWFRNYYRL